MADKQPPAAPSLREQIGAVQQKNSWQSTIVTAVVVLVIVLALVYYGVPDVEGDPGEIIFGLVAIAMVYLIFIRKRKQTVDADVLTQRLRREWQSGNLGSGTWDQLEFDLTSMQIEPISDDMRLVSCTNSYGGTKTLMIEGDDARSLSVKGIYDGDASSTRKKLEKSEFVRSAVAKGHELRDIEKLAEKLGR